MIAGLRENYIFVEPDAKAFKVASNYTNYVEIGVQGSSDYYLEARIENDEFLVNANLPNPHDSGICQVRDNFPEKSTCHKKMSPNGYHILSSSGELLLGIEVNRNICSLKGVIYDAQGNVVAQAEGNDFLVFRGPVVLGKSGTTRGIVIS